MHKQLSAFILVLVFFCVNQVFAQEVVTGDITQNLEPEMREGMKSLQPWMVDAQAVEFGPYKIYRPNDETSPKIWINGPRSEQLVSIDKNQVVIVSDISTVGTDDVTEMVFTKLLPMTSSEQTEKCLELFMTGTEMVILI